MVHQTLGVVAFGTLVVLTAAPVARSDNPAPQVLQLAAYQTRADAMVGWAKLTARYPDTLGTDVTPVVFDWPTRRSGNLVVLGAVAPAARHNNLLDRACRRIRRRGTMCHFVSVPPGSAVVPLLPTVSDTPTAGTAPAADPAAQSAGADPPAPAEPGRWVIQLGSYRLRDKALSGWQRLNRRYGDTLGNLKPILYELSSPERGAYQVIGVHGAAPPRLRSVCGDLRRRRASCLVSQLDPGKTVEPLDTAGHPDAGAADGSASHPDADIPAPEAVIVEPDAIAALAPAATTEPASLTELAALAETPAEVVAAATGAAAERQATDGETAETDAGAAETTEADAPEVETADADAADIPVAETRRPEAPETETPVTETAVTETLVTQTPVAARPVSETAAPAAETAEAGRVAAEPAAEVEVDPVASDPAGAIPATDTAVGGRTLIAAMPGIQLGYYWRERDARRGWQVLVRRHRSRLTGVAPAVFRVTASRRRSAVLLAGVGPAPADLETACRGLRRLGDACWATTVPAGATVIDAMAVAVPAPDPTAAPAAPTPEPAPAAAEPRTRATSALALRDLARPDVAPPEPHPAAAPPRSEAQAGPPDGDGAVAPAPVAAEPPAAPVAVAATVPIPAPVPLVLPGVKPPVPPEAGDQIVISIADRRLYYVGRDGRRRSFPVAIPRRRRDTIVGETEIVRKRRNPTWRPTPSMRREDPSLPEMVGPGPGNPLGRHALDLGFTYIRIHGTNRPRSVGRAASHGCYRMYPRDIKRLFGLVRVGTRVTVTWDPITKVAAHLLEPLPPVNVSG